MKHNLQYRTVPGTSTIINLAISTSDCGTSTRTIVSLYVSDLLNVTKSTVLVRTRVFRLRLPVTDTRTDGRTNTQHRFVKSGGCTVQITQRKRHRILYEKITRSGSRPQQTLKHNLQSSGLGHPPPPPFSGKISFIRNPSRYYLGST